MGATAFLARSGEGGRAVAEVAASRSPGKLSFVNSLTVAKVGTRGGHGKPGVVTMSPSASRMSSQVGRSAQKVASYVMHLVPLLCRPRHVVGWPWCTQRTAHHSRSREGFAAGASVAVGNA